MTRSKRFVSGLVSSYAAMGVNILFTLGSVPVALHYLTKEEFGLWALVTQLTGYLVLLEFGMAGSVSRFLADHKDDINGGTYGSILKTGARIFMLQGAAIVLAGLGLAAAAPYLLDLSFAHRATFSALMVLQAALTGCKVAAGSIAAPLWSHQRLDVSNLSGCVSLLVNFATLWISFQQGWKLYSMLLSTAAGFAAGLVVPYLACKRLGYYPETAARGKFDPEIFRELFGFAGGLFLMNLGAQLASASQTILVGRLLGLEAVSVWSISTKVFSLAQQFVSRILDASAGGLAELFVREENERLRRRFRDIVMLTGVLSITAAAGIALMNGAFVSIWTSGRISWPPSNDLLLAAVLFVTAITRCHTGLVGLTKQILGMKYVYLLEGVAFVSSTLVLGGMFGFQGMLIAAAISNLLITGVYAVRRTAGYFQIGAAEVGGWCGRPLLLFGLVMALFLVLQLPSLAAISPLLRLSLGAITFAFVFLPVLWAFGLPPEARSEGISMLKAGTAWISARLRRSHAG